jgi:Calcineurin-like phosphoesterase
MTKNSSSRPPRKSTPRAASTPQPVFAQPSPSPDPTSFRTPVTDQSDKELANLEPVPQPAGGAVEPTLTLAQAYGDAGATKTATIQAAGQIVFHCVGDTGSVKGPLTQSLVADKMVSDFTEQNAADVPSFLFHLGDVIYYFGEGAYYYDQFYEPYRMYPAPIIAIPGNHDGVVYGNDPAPTLDAFLRNFCAPSPVATPEAGGLARTAMIAPGVYYTLDAPFVKILGLYSNVLEDPGVISDENGANKTLDNRQIAFLTAALKRANSQSFAGAIIIAVHHPPITGGTDHRGSPKMLADIDSACTTAGLWPHAVFAGHAHNYQRYTRLVNNFQTPYIVAGCGGHSPLSPMRGTYRTPYKIDSTLTLESYDDTHYGYLRVTVGAQTMRIEFHPEADGSVTKTPDDVVTINLGARTIT